MNLAEIKNYRAPSFTTIKNWVQQVGYYKLKCAKTVANDWMVLIDASIQMGEKKCVVVLGCRVDSLRKIKKRALTLQNLESVLLVLRRS